MKRHVYEDETTQDIIKITELFFKYRFPNRNVEFEKKVHYFYEWVARIQYQKFWFFDDQSMRAYRRAIEEFRGLKK